MCGGTAVGFRDQDHRDLSPHIVSVTPYRSTGAMHVLCGPLHTFCSGCSLRALAFGDGLDPMMLEAKALQIVEVVEGAAVEPWHDVIHFDGGHAAAGGLAERVRFELGVSDSHPSASTELLCGRAFPGHVAVGAGLACGCDRAAFGADPGCLVGHGQVLAWAARRRCLVAA